MAELTTGDPTQEYTILTLGNLCGEQVKPPITMTIERYHELFWEANDSILLKTTAAEDSRLHTELLVPIGGQLSGVKFTVFPDFAVAEVWYQPWEPRWTSSGYYDTTWRSDSMTPEREYGTVQPVIEMAEFSNYGLRGTANNMGAIKDAFEDEISRQSFMDRVSEVIEAMPEGAKIDGMRVDYWDPKRMSNRALFIDNRVAEYMFNLRDTKGRRVDE